MTKSVVHSRLDRLDERFIRRRIRLVRRIDLTTTRIESLKAKLNDLLRAHVNFPLELGPGHSVFRARKHREDEREIDLSNVRDIYPNVKCLTRFGRAIRPRQPIYYFAADEGIALNEVKPSTDDVVTILECKPMLNASPVLIQIGIHQMADQHGARIGGDFPELAVRISELFENDASAIRKHKMISEFITEEFLRIVDDEEDHVYKLTIAIAELLLSFGSDFDPIVEPVNGLTYPSLASEKMNANMAFLPDAFHRIYRPFAAKRLTIAGPSTKARDGGEIHGFTYDDERLSKAIADNGDITW